MTSPYSNAIQIDLTPPDNKRLANLCGALDENLRQIETGFNVKITQRGERFSIKGEQARRAASALRHFYAQADEPLPIDAIQLGIVEFTQRPDAAQAANLPPAPTLMTRKTALTGRTPRQIEYLRNITTHDITFGLGPAGTGKTYLAVACAVDALERHQVDRLILTRPAVEAGERLGFLPGDLAQKVDPYLRPLYDALYDLLGFDKVGKLFERGTIEIAPLAFMRGRTLNHAFIILDEAQNTTTQQIKMFLTRMGLNTKMIITGDMTQIDLPINQKSGLIDALQVLKNVKGIAKIEFDVKDIVRHKLVQRIVEAYEKREKKPLTPKGEKEEEKKDIF